MALTKEEIKQLKKEWKAGSADALYKIAKHYQQIYKPRKGEKLLLKAANAGSAKAQYELSIYDGYDEKIAAKCAKWRKRAAEQGHIQAMLNLAEGYMYGWTRFGVPKDRSLAFHWYKKAAEKGNAEAMNWVAFLYSEGDGVRKSKSEAFKWRMLAAKKGDAEAQWRLGKCYMKGDGVDKDITQAIFWYQTGSENGSGEASSELADLYKEGVGVEKDAIKAVELFEKAVKQGDTSALNALGLIYRYGRPGVEVDIEKAYKCFKKGSELDKYDELAKKWAEELRREYPWVVSEKERREEKEKEELARANGSWYIRQKQELEDHRKRMDDIIKNW